jgi:hypothetical protein
MTVIERIEAKAQEWTWQPSFKLFNDEAPMHPYSVLQMLANELRVEAGLPLKTVWAQDSEGRWAWRDVVQETGSAP